MKFQSLQYYLEVCFAKQTAKSVTLHPLRQAFPDVIYCIYKQYSTSYSVRKNDPFIAQLPPSTNDHTKSTHDYVHNHKKLMYLQPVPKK